jgi:hypothetical protein
MRPTLGQQFSQYIFLHAGQTQSLGLNNEPTSLPQTEQKPLTILDPPEDSSFILY